MGRVVRRPSWTATHERILERATATARRLGIVRFSLDGIELDLGEDKTAPAAPASGPGIETPEPPDPPTVCKCGHEWTEHNETGCAHGCDLGSCGPALEEL